MKLPIISPLNENIKYTWDKEKKDHMKRVQDIKQRVNVLDKIQKEFDYRLYEKNKYKLNNSIFVQKEALTKIKSDNLILFQKLKSIDTRKTIQDENILSSRIYYPRTLNQKYKEKVQQEIEKENQNYRKRIFNQKSQLHAMLFRNQSEQKVRPNESQENSQIKENYIKRMLSKRLQQVEEKEQKTQD